MFGWVAPLLGQLGIVRAPNGDRQAFLACLKHLYRRLKRYTIWLYVDGAGWHKGQEITDFLQKHPRLRLEYLPRYQPGLNAQERVWRRVRYEATTNRWFESLEDTWKTIQKTTRSWTRKKIQSLCKIT